MKTTAKTVAETVDFESDSAEVAAIAGITEDEIGSTQRIVGIKPMVQSNIIVNLRDGVKVSVKFSRKYNGSVWMREAKNGSSYTWADITIMEFETTKHQLVCSTQVTDYRPALKAGQLVEGAAVRLNHDREGMLVRNEFGTFAEVRQIGDKTVPVCNQGQSKMIETLESKTYTRFLTTKHYNGEEMVYDAELKDILDVERYNDVLARKLATVKKALMARLPEDASEELVAAADVKADKVAENIVAGFGHCIRFKALRKARVLKMDGFRVFKYVKDTGIEFSTSLPSDKKETALCPVCGSENVSISEHGWTCGYGHMGDEELEIKTHYVDRYTRDPENTFRQLIDIAEELKKVAEFALRVELGITHTGRRFNGRCSFCAHCSARVYGQNQDPVQVVCSKGMRPDMVMAEHWEIEQRDVVGLGSNFYLMYSEAFSAPALYGDYRHTAKRHLWGNTNKRKVELSRMIHTDHSGVAGYEVPGHLSFDKLAFMYETFGKALLTDLLGDRTFSSKKERYIAYRETARGMMGDYLSMEKFVLLMDESKAEADAYALENDIELDAVADIEYFTQLLQVTHPLFQDIALERGVTRQVRELYPTVMHQMEIFIQPENNPRMTKAGDSSSVLMDMYDDDACLEFHWEFSDDAPAYGAIGLAASNELYARR